MSTVIRLKEIQLYFQSQLSLVRHYIVHYNTTHSTLPQLAAQLQVFTIYIL